MSDDLLKRLSRIGERVSIPCPDNIRGCLVFHYRVDTDPACVEAIDEIKRLRVENEQLRNVLHGLLNGVLNNVSVDRIELEMIRAARAALGK
jgi:hypothetical protein